MDILNPPPSYFQTRVDMFDRLKAEYEKEIAAKEKTPITITLPDGSTKEGKAWETTPQDIALGISKGLASKCIVAEVNGEVWDLNRILEGDCTLQLLTWDSEKAREVFFHSSAHMLGEVLEKCSGGCLCHGPPLEEGFFYDIDIEGKVVTTGDFAKLGEIMKTVAAENQPFERLDMKIDDIREMFKYNKYKQRFLDKIDTPTTTVYRCGPLIDLCRGPHIRSTKEVKAMEVNKTSAVYFGGDQTAESLQRVYGVSFPDNKKMKEYKKRMEMAAQANHSKIGKEQELFFFHQHSPGSAFFLPHGAMVYNKLIDHIKKEYRVRGFREVVTPNLFNTDLWVQSGHMKHYAEDMFMIESDKKQSEAHAANPDKVDKPQQFALKPMNCPGHFLMFNHRVRSHRELPMRFADFGVLHRNEKSGALHGLTRVRRFQQDDAHIFCTEDGIGAEMENCIDFLNSVYEKFGFSFDVGLSTRPEKYLGDLDVWNRAEAQLKETLAKVVGKFAINEGDGAFYGPKIDVNIKDALGRKFQCGTIQLDFQGPINFDMKYQGEDGEMHRPVVLHRAVLGSVERMFAILTENYIGKWPFWLSPRQAIVIPVGKGFNDYAVEVKQKLFNAGFESEVDIGGDVLNKKVARSSHFNFILVVGQKEMDSASVNIRVGKTNIGVKTVDDFLKNCEKLRDTFHRQNEWVLDVEELAEKTEKMEIEKKE